jgi:[ribosomal protein S5]-alanine N-acetyltransferase
MIKTNRFQLIAVKLPHLQAFAQGKDRLAALLQVTVPDSWPTFPEAFGLPEDASADESAFGEWGGYFFIHAQDRVLVGNGGFKGRPDASGAVEIGYEIASEYWNRGYATEIVRGMLDFAFAHADVKTVMAHTLGTPNASNNVLQKVGMKFASEMVDPDEGAIWQWQINRDEYEAARDG